MAQSSNRPLQIYKASAGTGKTFQLAKQYISMLLATIAQHAHRSILAVTFTKKATAEMKERIINELYYLATDQPSNYRADLQELLHIDKDELRDRSRTCLIDMLQDYSYFSVNTIDSFFQQVVRSFAHEMGLNSTYQIDLNEDSIRMRAVDDLFYQMQVSTSSDSLFHWISQYVKNNITEGDGWNPKSQILELSDQLSKERFRTLLRQNHELLHNKQHFSAYIGTLYSIIHRKEKQITDLQQRVQSALCAANLSKDDFARGALATFFSPLKELKYPLPPTVRKGIDNIESLVSKKAANREYLLSFASTSLAPCYSELDSVFDSAEMRDYYTAKQIVNHIYATAILSDIAEQIAATNEEENRLPISEIGSLINEIVQETDAPFIYEKIGQRIHHYMIDEFQDTSQVQWQNFAPLLRESLSHEKRNLIVGDVKQSIYRWRNSDWQLLNSTVENEFKGQATITSLTQNFRSSGVIVRFVADLFPTYVKKLQEQYDEATHRNTAEPSTLVQAYADVRDQVAAKELDGHLLVDIISPTDEQSFEQMAIEHCLKSVESAMSRGARPCDIAVLSPYKKELKEITRALVAAGYKVASNEGISVDSHPAIAFLIATLRSLVSNDDTTLQLTRRILYLSCTSPSEDILDLALSQPDLLSEKDAQLPELSMQDLFEFVHSLVELYNLDSISSALPYLTSFYDCIYHFSANNTPLPATFIDWWDMTGKAKSFVPMPFDEDAIQVMTIHKSKGLEFDCVIIPFATWYTDRLKRTPIIWCQPTAEPFSQLPVVAIEASSSLANTHFTAEYAEELLGIYLDNLNLAYVAFTRAKHELVIICPEHTTNKSGEKKKVSTVGNLLQECLRGEISDGKYEAGNAELRFEHRGKEAETSQSLQIVDYPTGDRLRQKHSWRDLYEQHNDISNSTLLLGTAMHELLSHILTVGDTEKAIQHIIEEGLITSSQADLAHQWLEQFFVLVEPYHWFDGTYPTIYLERDMLSSKHSLIRPDRVMIRGNEAVVIDYKFGKEHQTAYHRQVSRYMYQLKKMGYETKGYLVYVAEQKIEEVKGEFGIFR